MDRCRDLQPTIPKSDRLLAPASDLHAAYSHLHGNSLVLQALRRQQHDARTAEPAAHR